MSQVGNRTRKVTKKKKKANSGFTPELQAKFNLKKDRELELLKESFAEWSKKSVEDLLKEGEYELLQAYGINGPNVVVRVFNYMPTEAQEDEFRFEVNDKGDRLDRFQHRYLPVVRVLAVGEDSGGVKVGDFYTLNALRSMTIDNPQYEQWIKHPGNESNMDKVGQEPPRLLCNLKKYFGDSMFPINFMKLKMDDDDLHTFHINTVNLQNPIKDIDVFINFALSGISGIFGSSDAVSK